MAILEPNAALSNRWLSPDSDTGKTRGIDAAELLVHLNPRSEVACSSSRNWWISAGTGSGPSASVRQSRANVPGLIVPRAAAELGRELGASPMRDQEVRAIDDAAIDKQVGPRLLGSSARDDRDKGALVVPVHVVRPGRGHPAVETLAIDLHGDGRGRPAVRKRGEQLLGVRDHFAGPTRPARSQPTAVIT